MREIFWLLCYELFSKESYLKDYQNNARIYFDEYSGQEKLREEWFEKNIDNYFENRWMRRN